MQQIPNSLTRQILLILVIITLFSLIFWNLKEFVPSFLGAYTLYILLRRPMFYLHNQKKWPKSISAILLMVVSIIIFILPLNSLFQILGSKILPYFQNSEYLYTIVQDFIGDIERKYNIEIMTQENISSIGDWLVKEGGIFINATLKSVGVVALLYFILYFLMTNGSQIEGKFLSMLPLNEHSGRYLKKHLQSLVYSNAIGVPLVSLFQSLVALIGYWVAGVEEPFLWFVVTFIASFIPMLGAMLIYVPLSIILIYNGNLSGGIFLLAFGLLIVGSVDNLFRFWLQRKIGDTHPLITIFGVIIGLKIFGFIGLIFGPILISIVLLLLNLYNQEYSSTQPLDDVK